MRHAVLASLLALGAAAVFGIGNALEHREVQAFADDGLDPSLLGRLVRRRWWLIGMGCDVAGFVLHASALGVGGLLLVQPLLPLNLLFAIPLSARWHHRPVRAKELVAAGVLVIALAIFLHTAAPTEGDAHAPFGDWLPALVAVAAVIACGFAVVRNLRGTPRAVCLGVMSGVCYGSTSAFTKSFAHWFAQNPVSIFWHWESYGLAITTFLGLWLSQSMFQGVSIAVGLPLNETLEPITASAIGAFVLHESLRGESAAANTTIALSIVAMLLAVVVLSSATTEGVSQPAATLG